MTKYLAIAAFALAAASPAFAAEPVQIRVPTAGIDLSTSEGRAQLAERADRIADRECGIASASDLRGKRVVKECKEAVMASVEHLTAEPNTQLALAVTK